MHQLTKMFEGKNLTIVTNGERHDFLLKDLCNILGLGHVATVRRRLDEDVVSKHPLQTAGGTQQATFVNEDGLYDVILDSRKAVAKRFRKWITSEVLPTIRKTGGYVKENRAIDFVHSWLPQLDETSSHAIASTLEQNRALLTENKKLVTTIESQKPKVVYADAVSVSEDTVLVKDLATVLKQKGVDIGTNRLFEWLRSNGFLCRKKGEMWNAPTQKSLDLGIMVTKHGLRTGSDGEMKKTRTPKITGKGQIYFINKFLNQQEVI